MILPMENRHSTNLVLGCSVVLYNPDNSAINEITNLSKTFSQIVVVDNSSTENLSVKKLVKDNKNITYFPLYKNTGIAHALNIALSFAEKRGLDYLCTMDQDSIYPFSQHEKIKKYLMNSDQEKDAIVAIVPDLENPKSSAPEVQSVDMAITSGSFINVPLVSKAHISFNDDLFIDYVDFDFCEKIKRHGYKILKLNHILFKHSLGSSVKGRLLWKSFSSMNHSPIRDYYRYRNITYLYKKDKTFYRKIRLREFTVEIIKIFCAEKNRREKFKLIRRGVRDGKCLKQIL
jgi:rhamnosyltransferase